MTSYISEVMTDGMTGVVLNLSTRAATHLWDAIVDKEHNLSNCSEETKEILNRGIEQIKDERYEDAISSFEEAAKLDPTNISPKLRLMKVYKAQDADLTALVVGGGALNLATEPRSRAQIFNFLGEISTDIFQLSKFSPHITQAISFYDESIDENQEDVLPKWNRAKAYVLYQEHETDTEIKKIASHRAKISIDAVIRMGKERKGNSMKCWPKLIDDAENEGWWPNDDWWSDKYKEMRTIHRTR